MTTLTETGPATVAHTPVTNVLIANRGEIARRVIAACARRGIRTVAVFSDPDAEALHVQEADAAVRLPGTTSAETYLRVDLILDAARAAGADAIHPGYGFLSENADFARAVMDAGLTWIGPDPESIELMGSKSASKIEMEKAGVPVLTDMRPEDVREADLPVIVKASAGGGGRGMRIVDDLAALPAMLETASREAQSAFGDPTVLCERYLPRSHHIEVQVFGDRHGTVWAIGERECSLQRRHQKVVEEAPSPLVERIGGDLRERLLEAARNAASRIDYVGAGTVEFLADGDGNFYFLEMNTRLQVEHPVTECTTGLDLVDLQLYVAAGGALEGTPPALRGHAIEVRLYAEDPAAGWQPQSGPVHRLEFSGVASEFEVLTSPGLRLDAGFTSGSVIGTDYDPMIAKVIGVGADRSQAAQILAGGLERAQIHGPTTNRDLLVRTLREEEFLSGHTHTAYFDEHPEVLDPGAARDSLTALSAIAAALASAEAVLDGGGETLEPGEHALLESVRQTSPRPRIRGWRMVPDGYRTRTFSAGEQELSVRYRWERDRYVIDPDALPPGITALDVSCADSATVQLDADGLRRTFHVHDTGHTVFVDSTLGSVALGRAPRFEDPADVIAPGSMTAPMPGTVTRVLVGPGEQVTTGQPLLSMEAMKMERTINAEIDGLVADLRVAVGDRLDVGQLLVVLEENA